MTRECDSNFNMRSWNIPVFFNASHICPHNFSFHTLSLYFLFDMSYISSYLRTNSFNCSSISEEKLRSTQYDKTLETFCRRRSWISASESSRIPDWLGPVPSRQTFSLGDGDGTELRLDGDVPVGVNISIYTHMRKYFSSVTFRDGTET